MMQNFWRTTTLLKYAVTFIVWGGVARAELEAYSWGFSLAMSLALGTALFTMAGLGPKSALNHKMSLRRASHRSKILTGFVSSISQDLRYVVLASTDLAKVSLSLMTLNSCPHLALWFFLTFSDGPAIWTIQKLAILARQHINHDLEVRVTPNKMLGTILITIANYSLFLFYGSYRLFALHMAYLVATGLEHIVLESGGTRFPIDDPNDPLNFVIVRPLVRAEPDKRSNADSQ